MPKYHYFFGFFTFWGNYLFGKFQKQPFYFPESLLHTGGVSKFKDLTHSLILFNHLLKMSLCSNPLPAMPY